MLDIEKELKEVTSIGVAGHVRPDGDCVGSATAIYGYLKKLFPEKKIDLYLESFHPSFVFLDGAKEAKRTIEPETAYEAFVVVDCADEARIGVAYDAFRQAKKKIVIDHHVSNNGYGDISFVDGNASSACEMVYRLIVPERLDEQIAESLYLGIAHDTGIFQYSNTSRATLEAVAILVSKGINTARIIDETFHQKTYEQNQLLGRMLLASQLLLDGKCILSAISREEMEPLGVGPKDFEGVVNQLRITKGVEIAVLMYEIEPGTYKVSLRSNKGADVNKIAAAFGGGGHVKAAGCNIAGPQWEAIARLVQEVERGLEEFFGD